MSEHPVQLFSHYNLVGHVEQIMRFTTPFEGCLIAEGDIIRVHDGEDGPGKSGRVVMIREFPPSAGLVEVYFIPTDG